VIPDEEEDHDLPDRKIDVAALERAAGAAY
jgi:hypothetical protein